MKTEDIQSIRRERKNLYMEERNRSISDRRTTRLHSESKTSAMDNYRCQPRGMHHG